MEAEEKEELEKTISNHILNTMHFSDMFNLVSEEAKRRSKELIGGSSDEQLLNIQREITEWQSKAKSYVETRAHGARPGPDDSPRTVTSPASLPSLLCGRPRAIRTVGAAPKQHRTDGNPHRDRTAP